MVKALRSGDSRKIAKHKQKTQIQEIKDLTDSARDFLNSSKSDATKQAYRSDWKSFSSWAESRSLDPLPAKPATVALYITWLAAKKGRKPSTISRVLTSISQAHKAANLDTPTRSLEVVEVFKGIRRKKGTAQKRAKPLVLSELKKAVDSTRPTFLGRRDRALLLLGWAAALRRSELVALDRENIEFVEEGMIVQIVRSKTDQEGQGYKIGIPFAKNEKYCPVKILMSWIELAAIKAGPLFFSVGTPGKKFHTDVDEPRRLSAKWVNAIIKKRVEQAGLSPVGYSGHSLRAGFVTSAAKMEAPEHVIQIHTRHRSTKSLRGYIREGSLFASNPLSVML